MCFALLVLKFIYLLFLFCLKKEKRMKEKNCSFVSLNRNFITLNKTFLLMFCLYNNSFIELIRRGKI